MGMAIALNVQSVGDNVATTGDFVLLASEVPATAASKPPVPTAAERSGLTEPGAGDTAPAAPITEPTNSTIAAGPCITKTAAPGPGTGSCAVNPAADSAEPGSCNTTPPTANTKSAACITTPTRRNATHPGFNTKPAGGDPDLEICNTTEASGVLGFPVFVMPAAVRAAEFASGNTNFAGRLAAGAYGEGSTREPARSIAEKCGS
ncbi:MAG TPA: hypothetical protein VH988_26905 [Thermoanaerobaculia bacterium]|jgi:hypothetical protein|nr:hypothetical protein [Thermoanaerobaculia bacterium]